MRLRTLTEAECYSRLYGGKSSDKVSVIGAEHPAEEETLTGERLRELFETRRKPRNSEREAA